MGELVIAVILAIGTFVTIFLGVKIVPQGEKYVIQRLGKYHITLTPGLNFLIPYIDTVAYQVTTKDIVLDIPSQEVITKDNAVIITNAIGYINIVSPEKAVYGVDNYTIAIQNLIQTSLRSIVGEMDLDAALSSRDQIKAKLKASLSDDISDWGIVLKSVEIQDIKPSGTMQKAMEEQAAAERERRATVTRAEGDKTAAILKADGQLEASKREAEAQIILAEANKVAIEKVSSAIQDKELPALFLLGEKYVSSLEKMANSPSSKLVLLPGDISKTIEGLLKR